MLDKLAFTDFQAQLLDAVADAVIITDGRGAIIEWNRGAEEMYGWSRQAALGRDIIELALTGEAPVERASLIERFRAGQAWTGEVEGRRRDDSRFWVQVTDTPVLNQHRDLAAVITVSRDISERVEAQRVVAEQHRNLALLEGIAASLASELDHGRLVQGITDLSRDAIGAEVAAFFYNVHGGEEAPDRYSLYTLSGASPEQFAPMPMRRITEAFEPTFRGEGPVRSDDITLDPRFGKNYPFHGVPPGHVPICSYLAVAVTGRSGDVLGGLLFGHRKNGRFTTAHEHLVTGIARWAAIALDNANMFAEAQRIQYELRAANAAKDDLLDFVSHEVRTPLTTIVGNAVLLAERAEQLSGMEKTDAVEDIRRDAERLYQLVEDMLHLAKAEARLTEELEPILPFHLMRRVADEHRRRNPGRVVVELANPDHRPVTGSPVYFEHVLRNLLSNANKYSPVGTPIEVSMDEQGEWLEVRVLDRGMGISDSDAERIFDRFYRADGARPAPGVGLGLSVCKRLVELQGGRIWARPREGGGSEFGFSLRFAPEQ